MRNTVIGLAAAAAIITAGSTLNASAHHYGAYSGPQGEYGRGEYCREFERREHPRREFGGREYPRRKYGPSEYSERGGYREYRD